MNSLHIDKATAQKAYEEMSAADFIDHVTDFYLEQLGGGLTADNMASLNTDQHTLLAYRYLKDEVMEGGFIQLIINGYAGYILEGPFPMVLKKEWDMKDLSKLIFAARNEYHLHREELERDMTDEEFMALYEQLEKLNDLGDDFLDDYQEQTTPAVAKYVITNIDNF
ncbi:MAG: DMP19 family protein [Bacteroidaceae bacterium]|nr:DMP19 family protein [Bacteroidaceae bacterium]